MIRTSGVAALALAAMTALPMAASADENKDLDWHFVAGLPRPIEMAIVSGDPSKPGPFVVRYRMPSAMKLQPHTYPDTREIKVIKGIYWIAPGESYNWRSMDEYKAGSTYTMEAGKPYFCWARTAVIIEERGTGPSAIKFVHPEDDPRARRERPE
ncbi:MAG: hypothetical protein GC151_08120 [Betaproteobacteria bacterium]|nr:hypothetical protein [Betaproteobacteria bacterium]